MRQNHALMRLTHHPRWRGRTASRVARIRMGPLPHPWQ